MDYFPPINGDQGDPDRPYINANPQAGVQGSFPHAKAIEGPMREILEVIDQAGIARDGEDFSQLFQAIQLLNSSAGTLLRVDFFESSDVWSKPENCNAAFVVIVGGGGGGSGSGGGSPTVGATGGTSSFGSHCSATGGAGSGLPASGGGEGGLAGTGIGGDLNIGGADGHPGDDARAGPGGSSFLGGGGRGVATIGSGLDGKKYGGGGGGSRASGTGGSGGGGAGGGAFKFISDSLLSTETVTVGSGGAAGVGTYNGGAGSDGVVMVFSFT